MHCLGKHKLQENGAKDEEAEIFPVISCYAILHDISYKLWSDALMRYKCDQSVPPGPAAGVAAHKPGHRLVRGSNLLHVFAKGVLFVAEAALLACILVDVLLHLFVKTSPALLQLRQLVLPDVLSRLLVQIQLLVVEGQLARGDTSAQHLLLRLFGVLTGEAVADGVDAFVQGLLCFVCMQK